MSTPIYRATNPRNGTTLLTQTASEAKSAATSWGTTSEVAFYASRTAEAELVGVHRMYKAGDFAYEALPGRVTALTESGYVDQGVNFYAALESAWCAVPVKVDLSAQGRHGYAIEGTGDTAFYVAAPPASLGPPTTVKKIVPEKDPADRSFTFVVIPDTQQEVKQSSDRRFKSRSEHLVSVRTSRDLRWVIQTGDLVDWDTENHDQYENARAGLQPLIDAKIPLLLNIGNHDSQATGVGGGALDPRFTRTLARMTQVFNDYFKSSDSSIALGLFEPGKIDNTYTRVRAGGKNWMILSLELWPRKEVIKWAQGLVATNPHDNVIIATHAFVSTKGGIGTGKNYGSTTPKYLWDNLVKKYKNIKFVLSGHAGKGANFVKTGTHGNRIYLLLTTYHSNTTNPTRFVRINTQKQVITTWVDAPWTDERLLASVKYSNAGLVS